MTNPTIDITLSVLDAATALMQQVESVVVRHIIAFDRAEYQTRVTDRMVDKRPTALAACQNLGSGTEGWGE